MRLVAWQPDDLLRRLDDVVAVYGEAMGYRQELLQTRRGYIGAHVRRAGFRARSEEHTSELQSLV